jgi:hypothetical protein
VSTHEMDIVWSAFGVDYNGFADCGRSCATGRGTPRPVRDGRLYGTGLRVRRPVAPTHQRTRICARFFAGEGFGGTFAEPMCFGPHRRPGRR